MNKLYEFRISIHNKKYATISFSNLPFFSKSLFYSQNWEKLKKNNHSFQCL